jgi:small subunit ribosomal protein S21
MTKTMLTVVIRDNEPFDKAVRRFQTECKKAGILQIAKRKMYFEKPSRKRYLSRIKLKSRKPQNSSSRDKRPRGSG